MGGVSVDRAKMLAGLVRSGRRHWSRGSAKGERRRTRCGGGWLGGRFELVNESGLTLCHFQRSGIYERQSCSAFTTFRAEHDTLLAEFTTNSRFDSLGRCARRREFPNA